MVPLVNCQIVKPCLTVVNHVGRGTMIKMNLDSGSLTCECKESVCVHYSIGFEVLAELLTVKTLLPSLTRRDLPHMEERPLSEGVTSEKSLFPSPSRLLPVIKGNPCKSF